MVDHLAGPLHWEQLGKSGPLVVFVHPNPLDWRSWLYQMAHLSAWFRTVAVDLPGYGSPPSRPGLTMEDISTACWETVEEVAPEEAILVGLSVGSQVVLHMLRARPERVHAIILSGATYEPGPELYALMHNRADAYDHDGMAFRSAQVHENFSDAFRVTKQAAYLAEMFVERDDVADAASVARTYRAVAEDTVEGAVEHLYDIPVPALIITGSEDVVYEGALALRDRLGCELAVIDGAGHSCNLEQPWAWDGHALDFLRRHGLFT